jgi:hypothetical protein
MSEWSPRTSRAQAPRCGSHNSIAVKATPIWDEEIRFQKRIDSNGSHACVEDCEMKDAIEFTVSDVRYRT